MENIELIEIENRIFTIRGVQVILDRDLAILYQTDTRTLKQAVKRNIDRFPTDFMFELADSDINSMVSQFVIPSKSYFGGAKPFAFTEQGVAMLSAVIRTPIAINISLQIIRAFVKMRKLMTENTILFQRLDRVELNKLKPTRNLSRFLKPSKAPSHNPTKVYFTMGRYLMPGHLYPILSAAQTIPLFSSIII